MQRADRLRKLQLQANQHGRNVEHLQSRHAFLEEQKEEIERRLKAISTDRQTPLSAHRPTSQGLLNTEIVAGLKSQLHKLKETQPNAISSDLLPEITSLRQSYLRQGGSNPALLAQITKLEDEARSFLVEEQGRNHNNGYPDRHYDRRLSDIENRLETFRHDRGSGRQAPASRDYARSPERPTHRPPYIESVFAPPGADVPHLFTGRLDEDADTDPLDPAPYDDMAGLVIFYDFLIGLDVNTHFVRLITCLYNKEEQFGQPTTLPSIQSMPYDDAYHRQGSQIAVLNLKQAVERCAAMRDVTLIIELQTATSSGGKSSRLTSKAWAKLDLFDLRGQLMSGRWRCRLRMTPINPRLATQDLDTVAQYGTVELFVRLVNHRDAAAQSTSRVNPANMQRYREQPQSYYNETSRARGDSTKRDDVRLVRSLPSTAQSRTPSPVSPKPRKKQLEEYDYDAESGTMGFQVDRVKNGGRGDGKLRLTAYHKRSGKVVQSATSPVTCTTTTVGANFKHNYHVYGQQEATFRDVDIASDMVLVARFYLRKQAGDLQATSSDSEALVGWGSLPLMVERHGVSQVNVGTHVIPLYEAPLPDTDQLPTSDHYRPKLWRRYGKASARVHIFLDRPRPGSLTPSEDSEFEDEKSIMPEGAWIPHEPVKNPTQVFTATDGVDLYIDGARFLPDRVTITRVVGRVLTRTYAKACKDINAVLNMDSDCYNPTYETKIELREQRIPPSATIVLKVYTIDKLTKKVTLVGTAALNMFVAVGTNRQPKVDTGGVQVALNTGGHQLPLYASGPNGVDPLSAQTMKDAGNRRVPCASLLVRLYQAPVGKNSRPLEPDRIPQHDWARLGLWHPLPRYDDRVYYSLSCKPTRGECQMFEAHLRRSFLTVKDALRMIQSDNDVKNLVTLKQLKAHVNATISKTMDATPTDADLTAVATYDPKYGIKAALDSAMNLPWLNATHATMCLNPPGAFYMGQPAAAYDKLKFTSQLDTSSTTSTPVWRDGFFHFPHRAHHKHLALIIHLQEISVTLNRETYKYGLLDQAWTVLQVFNDGYVPTQLYQLPLFHGPPKPYLLRALLKEPARKWIITNVVNGNLKPIEGASVFVRLADGRRDEELPAPVSMSEQFVKLNVDYIPRVELEKYTRESPGKDILALVPPGKTPEQYQHNIGTKFKNLVYKLQEDMYARQN